MEDLEPGIVPNDECLDYRWVPPRSTQSSVVGQFPEWAFAAKWSTCEYAPLAQNLALPIRVRRWTLGDSRGAIASNPGLGVVQVRGGQVRTAGTEASEATKLNGQQQAAT